MIKNYPKLLTLSLALLFAVTPLVSSAKDKGLEVKVNASLSSDRDDMEIETEGKIEKSEKPEKSERSGKRLFNLSATSSASSTKGTSSKHKKEDKKICLRAFGHLIASGFKKNKGEVTIPDNCWLPFGIWKKLEGRATTTTGTTTPDTISPVISHLTATTSTTTADISWKTDEKANATVFWSTITPVNTAATTTASSSQSAYVKDHFLTISGLNATTTYFFLVRSADSSGNSTTSVEGSFTTK